MPFGDYIQSVKASTASATSLALPAFGTNNVAGNTILVGIRTGVSGRTITVTDTAGNTYVQDKSQVIPVSDDDVVVHRASNIVVGANTVTVSVSGAATSIRAAAAEYTGNCVLDQSPGASGTSTTPNSGSATTTVAAELLFGVAAVANDFDFTAGASYTEREQVLQKMSIEDRVVSVTGSYSASYTLSGGGDEWSCIMCSYSESVGAGGGGAQRGLGLLLGLRRNSLVRGA